MVSIKGFKGYVTLSIWEANPIPNLLKKKSSSMYLQNKQYINIDNSWVTNMIPKAIQTKLSKDEHTSSKFESQPENVNNNSIKKNLFAGLKPRDPPALLEKKKRLRQLRPTQFACEIEKTVYELLQEGKLPGAYHILSSCRVEQVLVDKGIRTCTVIWNIESNSYQEKNTMIDKLDSIRHVLRYELGQRLRFRSVPDIIFTGK